MPDISTAEFAELPEPTSNLTISTGQLRELVEFLCKSLVDEPTNVEVVQIEGEHTCLFALKVGSGDLGKVIGKKGRTARAMRTALMHLSDRAGKRTVLEIID